MNTKLQDILIEAGREADKTKTVPFMWEIESEQEMFIKAMAKEDLRGMRKHGTKLAALVIKVMVEKL